MENAITAPLDRLWSKLHRNSFVCCDVSGFEISYSVSTHSYSVKLVWCLSAVTTTSLTNAYEHMTWMGMKKVYA